MESELDVDRPATLDAGQGETVEQVHPNDKVERLGKRPLTDLRRQHQAPEHHRRGVAVEAVGQQPAAIHLEHGDRRHPLPRLGVPLDREFVEPVAQVQIWVKDQVIQR